MMLLYFSFFFQKAQQKIGKSFISQGRAIIKAIIIKYSLFYSHMFYTLPVADHTAILTDYSLYFAGKKTGAYKG